MSGSETSPIYQANSFPKRNALVVRSIHAVASLEVAECNCSLSFPKASGQLAAVVSCFCQNLKDAVGYEILRQKMEEMH